MARTKPHTKVHVSVAHHPKTQEVWANPFQRGMLVEIWRLAVERYAGSRGDILRLQPLDRQSISGIGEQSGADREILVLLRTLRYRVRKYPNRWDVSIRNLSKKHGFKPPESGTDEIPERLHKKEERRKKKEERREKREETVPVPADGLPAGYENGGWLAPQLKLNAKATEAERGLWLEAKWGEIVASGEIEQAEKPNSKLGPHVKKIASARWNKYLQTRNPAKREFHLEANSRQWQLSMDAAESVPVSEDPYQKLRRELDGD